MKCEDMEKRITEAYPDSTAAVLDPHESGNHFEVRVERGQELQKLSRIQLHRAIMGLFEKELHSGEVHALTIKTI